MKMALNITDVKTMGDIKIQDIEVDTIVYIRIISAPPKTAPEYGKGELFQRGL